MMAEERVWSVPVRVDDVHEGGRHFELRADEPTRARVAKTADVPGIEKLEASFDVTRHGADGLRVAGRVCATVAQTCVVTPGADDQRHRRTRRRRLRAFGRAA